MPLHNSQQRTFALQLQNSRNLLMLDFPRREADSSYRPRTEFWSGRNWARDQSIKRYKRYEKVHNFGKVSWSKILSIDMFDEVKPKQKEAKSMDEIKEMTFGRDKPPSKYSYSLLAQLLV